MLTVGSLFSGIGGLDLGLERAGMRVIWQCEADAYCRAVLEHHWPDVQCFEDIRELCVQGGWWVEPPDLLCGGFPCQPVSLAGKGLAQEDPRWLWPEFARVIGVLRPRYVFVENVPGLTNRGLGDVLRDLSAHGYDAEWQVVSAASVGAPHLRERLIVLAYPNGERELQQGAAIVSQWGRAGNGSSEGREALADADSAVGNRSRPTTEAVRRPETIERFGRRRGLRGDVQDANGRAVESWRLRWRAPQTSSEGIWAAEPDVGRVAHGVPARLDQLRVLGNAVVPQVAEFAGSLILEYEKERLAA